MSKKISKSAKKRQRELKVQRMVNARVKREIVKVAQQKRRLSAARFSRITSDWKTQLVTLDGDLRYDLRKLIERTRDLMHNDSIVERAALLYCNGVVGPEGIKFQNKFKTDAGYDKKVNQAIEQAINEYFASPEISGRHSMIDVLRLTMRHVFIDGNFFWRVRRDPSHAHNVSIELIDITMLALELNKTLPNGDEIRLGVQINGTTKKPVAYHFYEKNPFDTAVTGRSTVTASAIEVPAGEIIHFANIVESGQTLGLPLITQGVLKLRLHSMYEEAAIVLARMSAQCGAVLETQVPDDSTEHIGGGDDDAPFTMEFEPGMFTSLPPGTSVKQVQFGQGVERYEAVGNRLLRTVAGGLNLSFASLANDHNGLNLAVSKLVISEEREGYKGWQVYLINKGLRPIVTIHWAKWAPMENKHLKRLKLTAADLETKLVPQFYPRRWRSLDPSADANYFTTLMNAGVLSPEAVVRLVGEEDDFEAMSETTAANRELQKKLGIPIFTVSGQAVDAVQTETDEETGEQKPSSKKPVAAPAAKAPAKKVETQAEAPVAPVEDIQATALNGAQVTALVELVEKVGAGTLPLESAKWMAKAAFPAVSENVIASIFAPLTSFKPAAPEPKPQPEKPAEPEKVAA